MKALIGYTRDRLTRDNAVLLLIDHQVGLLWEPGATELRRNVAGLARAATILDVPTILTATASHVWGPIIPELIAAAPDTPVIERTIASVWDDPRVRRAVESTNRTKLIIAGIATEVCVAWAAQAAASAGYTVYAVIDASGHFSPRAATTAVVRMLEAEVIVTNSAPVVIEMVGDDADPVAREVLTLALGRTLPGPGLGSLSDRSLARIA
jgi:nicotinamidase-related amidase